jgi:hypothetical protein
MQTITQKDLKIEFIHAGMDRGSTYLGRPVYLTPPLDDVVHMLQTSMIDRFDYRAYTPDDKTDSEFLCWHYAFILQGLVCQEQYYSAPPYPWSLGIVWGRWPNGSGHAMNWARTEEGLYYVEPQDDAVHRWANSGFSPFFIVG